jgi:hypothetical protein
MKTIIHIESSLQDTIMRMNSNNALLFYLAPWSATTKSDLKYKMCFIAKKVGGEDLVNVIAIGGTDIGIWIDKGKIPRDFTLVKLRG